MIKIHRIVPRRTNLLCLHHIILSYHEKIVWKWGLRMRSIAIALGVVSIAFGAQAAPAPGANEGLMAIYVGSFSTLRDARHEAITVGGEYRFRDVYYGIRPTIGGFAAGNGEMYGYAGFNWDLPLSTAPILITPGFNVGAYDGHNGKNLGHALEFRSTLEVSYQFASHDRLGIAISHLSNAGLGSQNPGTETLQVVYAAPLW